MRKAFGKPLHVCTLAFYFKVFQEFPLVVAANRDEHYDRPSAAPARLDTRPAIIAGRDLRVGGTWLGINEHGLMVGILNRRTNGVGSGGADLRSRGLLSMDLLRIKNAAAAQRFMQAHREKYQPFTVVCADRERAWAAYNSRDKIALIALPQGLHVFSSAAEVDLRSEKAERAYHRFAQLVDEAAETKLSQTQTLAKLQSLLSDHDSLGIPRGNSQEVLCVHGEVSGTVSASVIFYSSSQQQFEMYYCPGPPCRNSFGQPLILPVL